MKKPEKPSPRRSSTELFSLSDTGEKTDADLHGPILDGGLETPAYREATRQLARKLGLSDEQVRLMFPEPG